MAFLYGSYICFQRKDLEKLRSGFRGLLRNKHHTIGRKKIVTNDRFLRLMIEDKRERTEKMENVLDYLEKTAKKYPTQIAVE